MGSSWAISSSTAVSRATSSSVNPARPTSWPVLVDLGQLREMIVREHVGKLGLFARVILEVHRDLLAAEQRGRFEPAVAACDEAAAVRDRDWRPPTHCLRSRRRWR